MFFSALRRSKKRVRAVVTTELPFLITKEFPPDQENDTTLLFDGASRASTVDVHKTRWMTLFKQLEHKLSEEESQLVIELRFPNHTSYLFSFASDMEFVNFENIQESWLNQVRYLQSHCDQGLQQLSLSSGQNFLHLGMPLDSRYGHFTTYSSHYQFNMFPQSKFLVSCCSNCVADL